MRNYVIGALTLGLIAIAAPATAATPIPVDCTKPVPDSIMGALSSAVEDDTIVVMGTCVEDVEIQIDGLTIQGPATVQGHIVVIGAQRVLIQDLTVEGDGTSAGIAVVQNAHVKTARVTVRQFDTGALAEGNASFEDEDSIFEDNSSVGILLDSNSSGSLSGSTIRNNGETGIHVFGGSFASINQCIIDEPAEGVSLNTGATAALSGNAITAAEALFLGWGSQAKITDNTFEGSSSAIFLFQGATLNQRNGADVATGPVLIHALSNAEFRNVTILGSVEVLDHSLLRFRDRAATPHATVTGNITVSQDSGLNFIKDAGERTVSVVGNITCMDQESSLFAPSSNVTITGNKTGCTGYNNSANAQ